MGDLRNSVERMMLRNVEKTPTCWNWTGGVRQNGQGRTTMGRKGYPPPRVFYAHFKGPIPEGHWVARTCKNNACVNPEHLQAMSPSDCIATTDSTSAMNARKTHCPRGHALFGANLYVDPRGWRQCKACAAIRDKSKENHFA